MKPLKFTFVYNAVIMFVLVVVQLQTKFMITELPRFVIFPSRVRKHCSYIQSGVITVIPVTNIFMKHSHIPEKVVEQPID